METIAQEAKRLLEPIPDEQWIEFDYTDSNSKCCAVGHWVRLHSDNPNDYSERNCEDFGDLEELRRQSALFLTGSPTCGTDITLVNNGDHTKYQQETPKARVITLLNDMIAAGY